MTYEIEFFLRSSEAVGDVVAALSDELRIKRRTIRMVPLGDGQDAGVKKNWAGYLSDSAGSLPPDTLLLEVFGDRILVEEEVALVGGEAANSRLSGVNLVAKLTIVGDEADWSVVRAIWEVLNTLWPVVVFDEAAGFDVDLSSLPGFS